MELKEGWDEKTDAVVRDVSQDPESVKRSVVTICIKPQFSIYHNSNYY